MQDNQQLPDTVARENQSIKKILLVEDNLCAQRLFLKLLSSFNCEVDTAENGMVALDKFMSTKYSLIFMDSVMPQMNGLEATKAIRAFEEKSGAAPTPIVMLTANDSPEDIQSSKDAGCNDMLTKPVLKPKLLEIIGRYTGITASVQPAETKSSAPPVAPQPAPDSNSEEIIIHPDQDLEPLIPGYLSKRRQDCTDLTEAVVNTDFETARIRGHSMKGTGKAYGFEKITEIGALIEKAAKEQDLAEIKNGIDQLKDYLDRIKVVYN